VLAFWFFILIAAAIICLLAWAGAAYLGSRGRNRRNHDDNPMF